MATQTLIYGNALTEWHDFPSKYPFMALGYCHRMPQILFFFWLPTGQSSLQMLQNWFTLAALCSVNQNMLTLHHW